MQGFHLGGLELVPHRGYLVKRFGQHMPADLGLRLQRIVSEFELLLGVGELYDRPVRIRSSMWSTGLAMKSQIPSATWSRSSRPARVVGRKGPRMRKSFDYRISVLGRMT
jgi:hypothetical protein